MRYQRIELARILQGDPRDEPYVFTYRPDTRDLEDSIRTHGLLTPPALIETAAGEFRVVCGSLRLRAIQHLGWKSVEGFVVSKREWTDAVCLARSLLENQWHRGFNEVEKAMVFTRLQDRYPHLVADLAGVLGKDLRLPGSEKALEAYRFILTLPEPILEGLAHSKMSLGQALLLRRFPASAQEPFFRVMTGSGLTLQESRKAAEWILESARREGKGPRELIGEDVLRSTLEGNGAPREKARTLLSALHGKRHPRLTAWKDRFAAACAQVAPTDEGVRVSHDPTFETTEIRVQIRARSEPEFRQRLETLSGALQEGRIEGLFQALCVEEDDSSQT